MFCVTLTPRSRSKDVFYCKCTYFIVNAPPPKLLDIATSNFAGT